MTGYITLDCQKCGGSLEISDEFEIYSCPYCGMQYLVQSSEKGITIRKLDERVSKVENEQTEIKINLLASDLEQIRSKINEVFSNLALKDDYKNQISYFRNSNIENLYRRELDLVNELRKKDAQINDTDDYINPVVILDIWNNLFPDLKGTIGFCTRIKGIKDIITQGQYFPTIRQAPNIILDLIASGGDPFVKIYPDQIKVRNHKVFKKKLVPILTKRFPNTEVK